MAIIGMADKALIAANAVVWGIPTALYLFLDVYQFSQGNWSWILLAIGPLPYGAMLLLSMLVLRRLFQAARPGPARVLGIAFLMLGVPVAAFSILLLGST